MNVAALEAAYERAKRTKLRNRKKAATLDQLTPASASVEYRMRKVVI